MDFARKQLEKYGWTDGKGLGKNENGIAQALKPKLKRSVAGIGHDAASDFTEHWWTQLYNKAAGNVEVEEKNGKTKKIKTKDTDGFEITNSTWKINKKKKKSDKEEQYADFFVRKAVLTNGGRQMEETENSSGSESEEEGKKKDVFNMTDEELFAACEGRTAHKGARHGLKATGKLARIAQQEQILLTQSQYEGYSHAKKRKADEKVSNELQISENTNENDIAIVTTKKDKKKKKSKTSQESESVLISLPADCEKTNSDSVASDKEIEDGSRNSNKAKINDVDEILNQENDDAVSKKKKKKLKSENINIDEAVETVGDKSSDYAVITKKVKKRKKPKE